MLKFNFINDIENRKKNEIKRKELLIKIQQQIDDTNKFTVRIADNTKQINFSFGIITNGLNDHYIRQIILSIEQNNIPNYEIIIVGNSKIDPTDRIRIIPFDENIKRAWITRKKNIITEQAKYENVVLLHDYIIFDNYWYNGFLRWGDDYEWCVNRIVNYDKTRFRDYTAVPTYLDKSLSQIVGVNDDYYYTHCLLPYDYENTIHTNKYMYISGSYYIIKKHIALQYPLDENLSYAEGEDVEYSNRLHNNNIVIKCNPYSRVGCLKQKVSARWENVMDNEHLQLFVSACNRI